MAEYPQTKELAHTRVHRLSAYSVLITSTPQLSTARPVKRKSSRLSIVHGYVVSNWYCRMGAQQALAGTSAGIDSHSRTFLLKLQSPSNLLTVWENGRLFVPLDNVEATVAFAPPFFMSSQESNAGLRLRDHFSARGWRGQGQSTGQLVQPFQPKVDSLRFRLSVYLAERFP